MDERPDPAPRPSRKRARERAGADSALESPGFQPPAAAQAGPAPGAKRARMEGQKETRPVLGMRPDGSFIQDPAWIRDAPDLSGVAFLPGVTLAKVVFTGKAMDLTDLGLVHCPEAVFTGADLTRTILKRIQCPGATFAGATVRREDLPVLRAGGAILREEDLVIVDGVADPLDFLDDRGHWARLGFTTLKGYPERNRYQGYKTAKAHFLRTGRARAPMFKILAGMDLGTFLANQRIVRSFEQVPEWNEALLALPGMAAVLEIEPADPAPADAGGAQEEKAALPLAILPSGGWLSSTGPIQPGFSLPHTVFLPDALLEGVDFTVVDLDGVDLGYTRCAGADFSQRNLCRTILKGMRCAGAKFRGCTLRAEDEAWLRQEGAILDGATFLQGVPDPVAFLDEQPKTDRSIGHRETRHRFYRILKALYVRDPALQVGKMAYKKRVAGIYLRQCLSDMKRKQKGFWEDAEWQAALRAIPSVGAVLDQPGGKKGGKSAPPASAAKSAPGAMVPEPEALAMPEGD